MSIRCRNCSASIDGVALELPRDPVNSADMAERDYVRVRMRCMNCQTSYAIAIDVDEFEIESLHQLLSMA